MEAVPRQPMISFDLKPCTAPADFTFSLKRYIAEFYHEDPDSYSRECSELDTLRHNVVDVSRDFMGCATLKKYFSQLQFLQSRFPLGEGGQIAIPFTWDDAYSGKSIVHADIRYEQACVLYNIGALHSILGAMDNRTSGEGMKVSCTHFQCAAWAFEHLRDSFSSSMSADLGSDLLSFKINLMLAQAQECILEKSMTDNRRSNITAKVATQIVDFYETALKFLDSRGISGAVGARRAKSWRRALECRAAYHNSVKLLHLGLQAEEQQKWGERVVYYKAASDALSECIKLGKGETELEEPLRFTMDVVVGKLQAAKKDNDFVYHDKMPELSSLPEVKGASLVRGIPFDPNDPEVAGEDIFKRLVPMVAHEAASLYSEEKAQFLRTLGSEVTEKDEALEKFMTSLGVTSADLQPETDRLPQVLLEKCAALSVRPEALRDLVTVMQDLSNISTDVEMNLKNITSLLEKESQDEVAFQKKFGPRPKMPMLEEIDKERMKLHEGLSMAGKSNSELHTAMRSHLTNLRLLAGPLEELRKTLPSLQKSEEDEAVVAELKRLLDKVEEMKQQRKKLHDDIRNQVHEDDITSRLVTRDEGDQQAFFRTELQKHEPTKALLQANLSAQDNILRALTDARAKFAHVRAQAEESRSARDFSVRGMIQSYEVYEDLLAKSRKGVEFYRRLEASVNGLLERTQRVCKTQNEVREAAEKRAATPAASPHSTGAGGDSTSLPTSGAMATLPAAVAGPQINGNVAVVAAAGTNLASALPRDVAPTGSGSGRKTLKDFLPFMKPDTWGKDGVKKTRESRESPDRGGGVRSDPTMPSLPAVAMGPGAAPGVATGPGHAAAVAMGPSAASTDRASILPAPTAAVAMAPPGHSAAVAMAPGAAPGIAMGPSAATTVAMAPGHATAVTMGPGGVSSISPGHSAAVAMAPPGHSAAVAMGQVPVSTPPFASLPAAAALPPTAAPSLQLQPQQQPPRAAPTSSHGPATPPAFPQQHPSATPHPAAPPPATATGLHQQQRATPPLQQHYQLQQPVVPQAPQLQPQSAPPGPAMAAPAPAPVSLSAGPGGRQQLPHAAPAQPVVPPQQHHPQQPMPQLPQHPPAPSPQLPQQPPAPPQQQHPQQPTNHAAVAATYTPRPAVAASAFLPHFAQNAAGQLQQQLQQQKQQQPYQRPQQQQLPQQPQQQLPQQPQQQLPQQPQQQLPQQPQQQLPQQPQQQLPQQPQQQLPQQPQQQLPQQQQQGAHHAQLQQHFIPQSQQHPLQPSTGSMPRQQPPGQQQHIQQQMQQQQGVHVAAPRSPLHQQQAVQPPQQQQYRYHHQQQQQQFYYQQQQHHPPQQQQHPQHSQQQQHQQQQIFQQHQSQHQQHPMHSSPSHSLPQQQPLQPLQQHQQQPFPQQQQQQQQRLFDEIPPGQTIPLQPQKVKPEATGGHLETNNHVESNANRIQNGGVQNGGDLEAGQSFETQTITSAESPKSSQSIFPKIQNQPKKEDNNSVLPPAPEVTSSSEVILNAVSSPKITPKHTSDSAANESRKSAEKDTKNWLLKDPLADQDTLQKFIADVEKFEKVVEALSKPNLNGQTALEKLWKDFADPVGAGRTTAIGRCYSVKNREQDVLPYDQTRVILNEARDDYINASFIDDLGDFAPKFIVTQAPLPVTTSDFWVMVFEQGCEVLVTLCPEVDPGKAKNHPFWPEARGDRARHGPLTLHLQSEKERPYWTERIINITHTQSRQSRSAIQLHFTTWPHISDPDSPSALLQFVNEVLSCHLQQRFLAKPILVNCSVGAGRSGAFVLLCASVAHVLRGLGVPDLAHLLAQLRTSRRFLLRDKDQLRFVHHAVLYCAQDLLMKRGILTNKASFSDPIPTRGDKNHARKPSEDFIMGKSSLQAIQQNIDKMNIATAITPSTVPTTTTTAVVPAATTEPTATTPTVATEAVRPPVESESPVAMETANTVDDSVALATSSKEAVAMESTPGQNSPNIFSQSLADVQNPQTFTIGTSTPPSRRKTTRNSFNEGNLGQISDNSDPLSSLDPLWSIKK